MQALFVINWLSHCCAEEAALRMRETSLLQGQGQGQGQGREVLQLAGVH